MQKAEAEHQLYRMRRVEYCFGHFEAGSVGLRKTDVNAGSCKTKVSLHFLFTWIEYPCLGTAALTSSENVL